MMRLTLAMFLFELSWHTLPRTHFIHTSECKLDSEVLSLASSSFTVIKMHDYSDYYVAFEMLKKNSIGYDLLVNHYEKQKVALSQVQLLSCDHPKIFMVKGYTWFGSSSCSSRLRGLII